MKEFGSNRPEKALFRQQLRQQFTLTVAGFTFQVKASNYISN